MCIFCVTINKLVGNDGQEFNEPGVSIFEVSTMYNVAQITYTDLASPSWSLYYSSGGLGQLFCPLRSGFLKIISRVKLILKSGFS